MCIYGFRSQVIITFSPKETYFTSSHFRQRQPLLLGDSRFFYLQPNGGREAIKSRKIYVVLDCPFVRGEVFYRIPFASYMSILFFSNKRLTLFVALFTFRKSRSRGWRIVKDRSLGKEKKKKKKFVSRAFELAQRTYRTGSSIVG